MSMEDSLGLTPIITSYENDEYRQTVDIELLRNLNMHGKIKIQTYIEGIQKYSPGPGAYRLTVQNVLEWVSLQPFECLDVCVDRMVVRTSSSSFRITTIGPVKVSTSNMHENINYETIGNKFCIKHTYCNHGTSYKYGLSIEKLTTR